MPTKEAKLRALKGSIRKWERVVAGEDEGSLSCHCCLLAGALPCGTACLIGEDSGSACSATPYNAWDEATPCGMAKVANTPELKALAQAELDYLEDLYERLTV